MRRFRLVALTLTALAAAGLASAALTPPASLSVMADTPTTLKLQWSAPTEAECAPGPVCQSEVIAWMVERCTGTCLAPASDTWTLIGVTAVGTTTFTATGLTAGTAYSFRVRATPYSSSGFGTPSTTTTTASTTSTTTTTTTTTTVTTTTTTTTTTSTTTTTVATTTTTTGAGTTTTTLRPLAPILSGLIPAIGNAKDIVLNAGGTSAYIGGQDFGLSIVDVSAPGSAHATGFTAAPYAGINVSLVTSTLAVTANGTNGFTVVDLTTAPAGAVGKLTGTFGSAASDGTRAYTLQTISGNPATTQLDVISVATPASPSVVGHVTLTGDSVRVAGTVAYVHSNGIIAVDVSTPASPAVLGSVSSGGTTTQSTGNNLALNGNYAYLAETTALVVANITTPSAPTIVTSLPVNVNAVAVDGVRLYAVYSTGFKVYDISNPAAPALLGTGTLTDGDSQVGVVAKGTNAYSVGLKGLHVWNVTTPASPTLVTTVSGVYNNVGVGRSGNSALTTGGTLGARVLDVSNAALPAIKGSLAGNFGDAVVSGTKGYVLQTISGNPSTTFVKVVDLTTLTSPAIIGSFQLAGGASKLALSGTRLYVNGSPGLVILDVSTPTSPTQLGSLAVSGVCIGLDGDASTVYEACGTTLAVINVSVPQTPSLTTTVSMTQATRAALSGTLLAVLDFTNLKLLDVSTPASPSLLSTTTNYGAIDVDYVAPLVYMASAQNNHLTVVNASNTASPSLVTQVVTPGAASSVVGDTVHVYVGEKAGTLDIITLRP